MLSLAAGVQRLLALVAILACSGALGQAVSGPSPSATTNAVPSFLDNKHLKDNPTVTIVGGMLYINGVAVLTNAPAGTTFSVNGTLSSSPNLVDTSTLVIVLTSTNISFYPTNLVNAQIASGAAIAESKISGLVSDLAAKQTGALNLTNWSAVGTNAFVNTNGTGFPALTGDVTTVQGAVATTLKNTGTAGTYRSVTFDAQGRETSGSNPTTFSGYGLSDTSANLAAALTDEDGNGAALFSNANFQTNATLAGTSLSGTTTNTSTFSGTFTNTGAMGVSGNTTFGGNTTWTGTPTLTTIGSPTWSGGSIFGGNLQVPSTGRYTWATKCIVQSPTDGIIELTDNAIGNFTRVDFGGTTAAFPALTRTLAGFTITGADGTANSTNSLIVPGLVTATNGVASLDTTAGVNIASTGWTNTFGKNAVVYFDGTAVTAKVYNSAGTAIYTNAVALTGDSILLQPGGAVVLSGTGVTGRATPF